MFEKYLKPKGIMGGILTSDMIRQEVNAGRIHIENFTEESLNPNSYNLTLGNTITVYNSIRLIDLKDKSTFSGDHVSTLKLDDEGIILRPGYIYLIPTAEEIGSQYYEPIFTGRSSAGRLGISIHQEAGFGDIGYYGHMTHQIKVTFPTKIYPGLSLAQVYWLSPCGIIDKPYNGRYMNDNGYASKGV